MNEEDRDEVSVSLAREVIVRDQYGERHVLNAEQWFLHAWFRPVLKRS